MKRVFMKRLSAWSPNSPLEILLCFICLYHIVQTPHASRQIPLCRGHHAGAEMSVSPSIPNT